jgi:hypothetical protein
MEGDVMAKIFLRCASVVIALSIVAPFLRAEQKQDSAKACATLVGTWKLASAKYGGNESALPVETTTLKHVTPAQFMWVSYGTSGAIERAAGGSYTLKGESYQETPEYGISSDFDVIKGKAQTFTCRVDGNRWYHSGALSNGLTIEEVWDRVEPK